MQSYETTDWHGLYAQGWGDDLVPEAFSHPAKVRPALARKIYDHAVGEGWLSPGDVVVDPFGGVGGFALSAMRHGLHFAGVELEERFVELGRQNIELWDRKYSGFSNWGTARLIQGDSRELAQVVRETGAVVSSPPFAAAQHTDRRADNNKFQQGCVGSRPRKNPVKYINPDSPGQLAALPEGDLSACISSPPYTASLASDDPDKRGGLFRDPKRRGDKTLTAEYGDSVGQLGAMSEGEFAAGVVSSPPYADSPIRNDLDCPPGKLQQAKANNETAMRATWGSNAGSVGQKMYGSTTGQLGQESGSTFWSAARVIVSQVYQILKPGGVAIWVTKSFVRKGERVDFPGQWRQLCEAAGFETLHEHRAWLVEERGAQYTLDGELERQTVERKSFFRRLAEQKGSPSIDWETVLCMRKPS